MPGRQNHKTMGSALLFGLIGYPLSHSFSKRYFSAKFAAEGLADRCQYELFPLKDIADLPALLHACPQLRGLNVTLPYKSAVIPYLSSYSAEVSQIGAVNVIDITSEGLRGYNTDVVGFEVSLRGLLEKAAAAPAQALVLGSGGSSKAVCWVLQKLQIPYRLVSRRGSADTISYEALDRDIMSNCQLIINTTPLGMYPETDACPPIRYDWISSQHLLFDLVYNPEETLFLQRGKAAGARVQGGLDMLYAQAEAAWQIWTANSQTK